MMVLLKSTNIHSLMYPRKFMFYYPPLSRSVVAYNTYEMCTNMYFISEMGKQNVMEVSIQYNSIGTNINDSR